jgi:hypothetical protein
MCRYFIASVVMLAVAHAAQGAPTTSLVRVPISPAAIAADPALANSQTWDLRVNIDPGRTWSATGFTVRLSGGSFYNPPLGAQGPLPQLWDLFPHLRHDTFVTHAARPDEPSTFGLPLIQSGYPYPPVTPWVFNDTEMSLIYTWTAAQSSGPGTFTVARLTISNGAYGAIIGESHQYDLQATTTEVLPFSLFIPEPAGATSVAAALLTMAVARRDRRRRLASAGAGQ